MAKANFRPVDIDGDEVLSRVQTNVGEAFSNLDAPTALSVKTVTSQYTVSNSDDFILADPTRASFSVVLPDPKALTKSASIRVIGSSGNSVSVQPASPSVTIDGSPSVRLVPLGKLRVVSDGSNYWTVS